jgi:hypothetical protein
MKTKPKRRRAAKHISNFCKKFSVTSMSSEDLSGNLNELFQLGRELSSTDELLGPYGKRLSGRNHSQVWRS